MEDKRKIANQELPSVLDSGLIQVDTKSSENFVELQPVQNITEENDSSVSNNFNINVNVTEPTNYAETQITNTINKALPTVSELPSDIKKNSSQKLPQQSDQEKKESISIPLSVDVSEDSPLPQKNDTPITTTNNPVFKSDPEQLKNIKSASERLKQKEIEQLGAPIVYEPPPETEKINIGTAISELYSDPMPLSVDLLQLENGIGDENITMYNYTNSILANKNQTFNNNQIELRDVIKNTLNVNNEMIISPATSADPGIMPSNNYYNISSGGDDYSVIQNQQNIESSSLENNVNVVNDLSKQETTVENGRIQESKNKQQIKEDNIDNTIDDMTDDVSSNINLNTMQQGAGSENRKFTQNQRTLNLKNTPSTISLTQHSMNKPPVWRSVLG